MPIPSHPYGGCFGTKLEDPHLAGWSESCATGAGAAPPPEEALGGARAGRWISEEARRRGAKILRKAMRIPTRPQDFEKDLAPPKGRERRRYALLLSSQKEGREVRGDGAGHL
jgi:hypothetical protein